jgi:pilus assembly protein CpaC
MMKKLLCSLGIGLLTPVLVPVATAQTAPPSVDQADAQAVGLEVGASRTLSGRGPVTQVVVDVPGIVRVAAAGARAMRITGVQTGDAHVTIVSGRARSEYSVHVGAGGSSDTEQMRRHLSSHPDLADVWVERRDGKVVISGAVPDLAAHIRAMAMATALGGKDVTDLIEVAGNQMVAVDIRFVAVSDTTLKSLGLNFSKLGGGFQTAVISPNSLTSQSFSKSTGLQVASGPPVQNAFNLFLASQGSGIVGMLSALSDAGLSQTLAQPTLLARSGEKADFLAGGEIPIPVPQGGSASGAITIEYRQYGVRLSVEPYVLSNKRIVLKLAPEVSELDPANGVTIQGFNVPGFLRRSANTTVELGDGESFVIAGLTYSTSTSDDSKVPMFGDIPILGSLFKRTQRSLQKLELIIVATPHLVKPMQEDDVKRMLPTTITPDTLSAAIMNKNSVEHRAAEFGLSR